jgi:sigma-B regulation protein RsbU (phosphoserine phosphatase)
MSHRDDVTSGAGTEISLEEDGKDLFEDAPCGLISTTMDGTIVRANRTFLEWLGYEADDLIGRKHFSDLLTSGGRIYHETHYAPLLQMQGLAREIAIDIVTADGKALPALVNSVVSHKGEGRPPTIRTAIFHASMRRGYERELLAARRNAEESEAQVRVLAETLQASLIPPTPPQIPGLDVGAAFRPAGSGAEVGGDFYDVFETAKDDWVVVIGDVCGKGAKAATVTALARYTVRAAAIQAREPTLVLRVLNDAMLRQQPDTFCTVAYARVKRSLAEGVAVTIAVGGHPLPLLATNDGSVGTVGVPGTAIGILSDASLHDHELKLDAGDVLTFFTDGVSEGRAGAEFFGEERLTEIVVENRNDDAMSIAERIVREVVEFQEGLPRDDIAVLVLKAASRT